MILMDEHEKKSLEDAVEKIIEEREEKKRQSMRTPPIEKKDAVKEAPTPEKKKNKMKRVDVALLIIVIAGVLIWVAWPSIMTEEVETTIVYPANVVLDSFDDGSNGYTTLKWVYPVHPLPLVVQPVDDYVDVSFELKNTGDEVAKDVSCFIKCCDQNGTILFAQLFTFDNIRPSMPGNLPYMRSYRVPISNETLYVIHNIDIRWSPQGANTYTEITVL